MCAPSSWKVGCLHLPMDVTKLTDCHLLDLAVCLFGIPRLAGEQMLGRRGILKVHPGLQHISNAHLRLDLLHSLCGAEQMGGRMRSTWAACVQSCTSHHHSRLFIALRSVLRAMMVLRRLRERLTCSLDPHPQNPFRCTLLSPEDVFSMFAVAPYHI